MVAFVEDGTDKLLAENALTKVGRHSFREIRKLACAARLGGREDVFTPVRMLDEHPAFLIASTEHSRGFAREFPDRDFFHV